MKNFLIITGLLASVYALPTCWAKEANPCDVQYPIASTVSQLIVVEPVGGVKAKLFLCEKKRIWQPKNSSAIPAVLGQSGVAEPGMKIEGDKKTPAGLFRIHNVFASNPMSLRMDTRFVTKEDKFIDDVNSSEYNTWITGPTTANSYEPMLIDIYRMGAVIDYNTSPIIPGKGSAIFLHIWRSENQGTHGCIAMEEKNLQLLLQWLDKNKNPSILIISKTTLNSRRLELPNK